MSDYDSFVSGAGVSPTLRDSELTKEADVIRVRYRRKAELLATSAIEAWLPAQAHVKELRGTALSSCHIQLAVCCDKNTVSAYFR